MQRRPLSWVTKDEEEYARSWDAEDRQRLGRKRHSRSSHGGNKGMEVRKQVDFPRDSEKSKVLAAKFLQRKGS